MWRTTLRVLRSGPSLALTVTAAVVALLLQVWLPNLGLIWSVTASSAMSVAAKARFLWASLGALTTNFTVLGAWLAGAVALLFGLNVAFTVAYLRQHTEWQQAGGLGGGAGLLATILGVGCSACGAVVLSSVLGTTTAASVVGVLPLHGQEFTLLAIAILAATLTVTIRRLATPETCSPPDPATTPR